jgi:hypothetical protein
MALMALGLMSAAVPAGADLRFETELTYVADIDSGAVHFTSEVTLTNLTPNEQSGEEIIFFYYDTVELFVPDGVENFSVTSGGRQLDYAIDESDAPEDEGLLVATIRFGRRLLFEQHITLLIDYEVFGDPPRSESSFRVNQAYFSFPIIGWGDPGRVSVKLVVPETFEVILEGSDIGDGTTDDGLTTYTASDIEDVESFFIFARGWDDSALSKTELEVSGVPIVVRGWPGDDVWTDEVIESVRLGLPKLRDLVGLDWTSEEPLLMTESLEVNLAGYGGRFIDEGNLIEIGEWVDPQLVLHELSHVWFNGELFRERWINEGLAEEFSTRAADATGLAVEEDLRPSVEPRPHRLIDGLNDWVTPDQVQELIDEDDLNAYETHGYEASFWVVQEITEEIGVDALTDVLEAAAEDEIAYQGEPRPEPVEGTDDWRRFLDLLQEIGGSTTAEDLFVRLVTTEDLSERSAARLEYHRLVQLAPGWRMPLVVRAEMSEWDFDEAMIELASIEELLGKRFEIEAGLEVLGVAPSDTLEDQFETATDSLGEAQALADALLAATNVALGVKAGLDADRGLVAAIGLIGEDVEAEYTDVEEALTGEDFDAVTVESAEVIELLEEATGKGATRLGVVGGAVMLSVGVGWLARRRTRMAKAPFTKPRNDQ